MVGGCIGAGSNGVVIVDDNSYSGGGSCGECGGSHGNCDGG